MAHEILNDKRWSNILHNPGFDIWQRGTILGGTFGPTATTTSSSTAISALTNVVSRIRVGYTVTGASIGAAKTVSSLTSNTAIAVNSSTGITTATGTATVQVGVPTTVIGPDRFFPISETTGVAMSQTAGNNAKNACLITNNAYATNQHFGIAQIVASEDTVSLRGSTVTFQVSFQNSNGLPINAAILEWTGAIDTVTRNVVSDWTKTDYSTATASGKFFAYTTLNVTAVTSGVTPTAANTWTNLSVQGQVSSAANNIVVFVWTQSPFTSGSTLTVSEMSLTESPVAVDYYPVNISDQSVFCRKHFERLDIPTSAIIANGFSLSSTVSNATIHYLDKRVVPTVTFVGLPADVTVTDTSASHAATGVAITLPSKHAAMVGVTVASGLTGGQANIVVSSGNATAPAFEINADL